MFRYLTLDGAESYVASTPNAFWHGWDIKVFTPKPRAEFDPRGVRHDGKFGYIYTVVSPNASGRYKVKK